MAPFAVAVNRFDVLSAAQRAEVERALAHTTATDGVGPLSEDARLRLGRGVGAVDHLVVTDPDGDDGAVTGYAQLVRNDDPEASAELFVVPEWRRRGIGAAVARAVLADAPSVSIWAHGDLPGSATLADRLGLVRVRDLWQMRARLPAGSSTEPVVPSGLTIRTFVPGQDEAAWLRLNADAFASHPEQGSWTATDLELRENEPWFDPAGFFLAERDGTLVGFHWTKIHPAGSEEPEALGEVYVLGVAPSAAGQGLGSLLTTVGLRHLAARGLRTVLLYVEATNPAAIAVYERQGFRRHAVDVSYRTA